MGENDRDIGRLEGKVDSIQKDVAHLTDLMEGMMMHGCSRGKEHDILATKVEEQGKKIDLVASDLSSAKLWDKIVTVILGLVAGGTGNVISK